MVKLLSLTKNVRRSGDDHLEPVVTPVANRVMMGKTVVLVSLLVRSAVNILGVSHTATKRVLHVSKRVRGRVSIRGLAPCRAQRPATGYRVMSAVPKNSPVVISAQGSVGRLAPKSTATSVP